MTEPRIIAEFSDYNGMLGALRLRAKERNLALSAEENADVSGLPNKYLAKLLGANPIRRLGAISMGPVLAVLGVKLVMVEDAEALKRYAAQVKSHNPNLIHGNTTYFVMTERKLRKNQAKGRKSRWGNMTREQRSKAMRRVVRARWAKPRLVKLTGAKLKRAKQVLGCK